MKIAIYARVSSDEQFTDNQLPQLEAYAKSKGYEVVAVYTENESAWKAGHQRELARLFSELPQTAPQICLVWAIDRLTREGIQRIFEVIQKFRKYGVKIDSLQEPWIYQDGPFAELMTVIIAWLAKFQSDRKSEAVKAGLARRRREGLPVGRQKGSKDKRKRQNAGYILRQHPELKGKYE